MHQDSLHNYHYIYEPGSADSSLTLLLLHGTGGDERSLWDVGRALYPGAHMLSPRGNVLEGQHNRFFERFSDGVFNEEDVRRRSKELSQFIEAAKVKHTLRDTAVVAVGFSNGANIAASVLLLHPTTLNGAVLLRAMLPLTPKNVSLKAKPILMLSGTKDKMMPETSALALAELLRTGGANLQHEWLDTGHGLTQQDIEISSKWLADNF